MKNVHIVTGGSSGIGFESAKLFKNETVVITGLNENKLIKATEELKALDIDAHYLVSDISSLQSSVELIEFSSKLGNIKTVINSAGVSGGQANAKNTFKIDLLGVEYLLNEVLKESNDTVVILIASMMGHTIKDDEKYDFLLLNSTKDNNVDKLVEVVNDESDIAYNFAKKGVIMLAEKYAKAFGEKNSRIVSLSPGVIMTPMAELAAKDHPEQMAYLKSVTPAQRFGQVSDISNAIKFLISDQASFITGSDLRVDGGLAKNIGA